MLIISTLKTTIVFELLYHFVQFGRHASQDLWPWPKLVACPMSQANWPALKNNHEKPDFFRALWMPKISKMANLNS